MHVTHDTRGHVASGGGVSSPLRDADCYQQQHWDTKWRVESRDGQLGLERRLIGHRTSLPSPIIGGEKVGEGRRSWLDPVRAQLNARRGI